MDNFFSLDACSRPMCTYTRYNNEVPVDKRVFKNVKLFMENKKDGDDLFDRLNTSVSII